jgi:hypothetical protein
MPAPTWKQEIFVFLPMMLMREQLRTAPKVKFELKSMRIQGEPIQGELKQKWTVDSEINALVDGGPAMNWQDCATERRLKA